MFKSEFEHGAYSQLVYAYSEEASIQLLSEIFENPWNSSDGWTPLQYKSRDMTSDCLQACRLYNGQFDPVEANP